MIEFELRGVPMPSVSACPRVHRLFSCKYYHPHHPSKLDRLL